MGFIRKIISSRPKKSEDIFYTDLSKILGFKPITITHYQKAFVHRSIKEFDKKTGFPFSM